MNDPIPTDDPFRNLGGVDNGYVGRDSGAALQPLADLGGQPASAIDARPNPRHVSNLVSRSRWVGTDPYHRSEFVWAWGQFLDHELDLIETVPADEEPLLQIPIPDDDPKLEFRGSSIGFARSARSDDGQLVNQHTSYVDASNVYGVDPTKLGDLTGARGRLRTQPSGRTGEQLLPYFQAPQFLAGDKRVNEHCILICLHTVFVREHNYWAEELVAWDPTLDDEDVFEMARKIVGAEMQAITYNEFLPALLGADPLPPYIGFDPAVNPAVSNLFASAAYRVGHTMVPDDVLVGPSGYRLALTDVFFAPEFVSRLGVDAFLSNLAYRMIEPVDPHVADGLRDGLFRAEHHPAALLDLATLNIQRGRDHGLPSFNRCREILGLSPRADFDDLTGDPALAAALRKAYADDFEALDVWVGLLSEPHHGPRRVGETLFHALVDQFRRTRDGDYYWYQNDPWFHPHLRETIHHTRLSDVLRRTTNVLVPDDVFHVPPNW